MSKKDKTATAPGDAPSRSKSMKISGKIKSLAVFSKLAKSLKSTSSKEKKESSSSRLSSSTSVKKTKDTAASKPASPVPASTVRASTPIVSSTRSRASAPPAVTTPEKETKLQVELSKKSPVVAAVPVTPTPATETPPVIPTPAPTQPLEADDNADRISVDTEPEEEEKQQPLSPLPALRSTEQLVEKPKKEEERFELPAAETGAVHRPSFLEPEQRKSSEEVKEKVPEPVVELPAEEISREVTPAPVEKKAEEKAEESTPAHAPVAVEEVSKPVSEPETVKETVRTVIPEPTPAASDDGHDEPKEKVDLAPLDTTPAPADRSLPPTPQSLEAPRMDTTVESEVGKPEEQTFKILPVEEPEQTFHILPVEETTQRMPDTPPEEKDEQAVDAELQDWIRGEYPAAIAAEGGLAAEEKVVDEQEELVRAEIADIHHREEADRIQKAKSESALKKLAEQEAERLQPAAPSGLMDSIYAPADLSDSIYAPRPAPVPAPLESPPCPPSVHHSCCQHHLQTAALVPTPLPKAIDILEDYRTIDNALNTPVVRHYYSHPATHTVTKDDFKQTIPPTSIFKVNDTTVLLLTPASNRKKSRKHLSTHTNLTVLPRFHPITATSPGEFKALLVDLTNNCPLPGIHEFITALSGIYNLTEELRDDIALIGAFPTNYRATDDIMNMPVGRLYFHYEQEENEDDELEGYTPRERNPTKLAHYLMELDVWEEDCYASHWVDDKTIEIFCRREVRDEVAHRIMSWAPFTLVPAWSPAMPKDGGSAKDLMIRGLVEVVVRNCTVGEEKCEELRAFVERLCSDMGMREEWEEAYDEEKRDFELWGRETKIWCEAEDDEEDVSFMSNLSSTWSNDSTLYAQEEVKEGEQIPRYMMDLKQRYHYDAAYTHVH